MGGAAAVLAMMALSCLDDTLIGPAGSSVQLQLSAQVVGEQTGRFVDLRVFYLRTTGAAIPVLERQIPLAVGTQQITVTVDVARCLADPLRVVMTDTPGCPLNVTFRLLDAVGEVFDSTTVGPVDGTPGETSEVPTVTLEQRVTAVVVTPATASVAVGQTTQLQGVAQDTVGRVVAGRSVAWSSSNEAIATVSSAGLVSGIAVGSATITATTDGRSGMAALTVLPLPNAPVFSVTVNPPAASLAVGETVQLASIARDAAGVVLTGRTVDWASGNHSVATVTTSGLVAAIQPCQATITATVEGRMGTATITVRPVPVAEVILGPASPSVMVGSAVQLIATVKDAAGNALTGRVVTFASSDLNIATVDGTGLVTGRVAGSVTITATSEGRTGAVVVAVTNVPVASVSVAPGSTSILVGTSQQFVATARDVAGSILTGRAVTWTSSDPVTASINATTGVASGLLIGSVTITATVEGQSGTAQLTVIPVPPVPVASVTVSPVLDTLTVGETVQLSSTARDASGNVLIGRMVAWTSSNPGIATVTSFGVVTAINPGEATVTATIEGQVGSATIVVRPVPVAEVVLGPASPSVMVGQTVQLTATVKDAAGNVLTGRVVTFASSDPNIATVDGTGLVTGRVAGSATISATSEGKTGTVVVAVTNVPVASVSVAPGSTSILVGTSQQFVATTRDASGNILTGRAVTWTSSDPSTASINATTGVASGLLIGSVTITATVEGQSGTAQLTVIPVPPVPVASVTVSPALDTLTVGETVQLSSTARDASGNVLIGRMVAWVSSNPGVAAVTDAGLVTGINPGETTVTATIEGQVGTATIIVRPVPVAEVVLGPGSPSVMVGQTVQLTATVKDAAGNVLSGRVVTFASSDPGIATVDGTGLVTGRVAGSATITATSEGKTGTIVVIVMNVPVASVSVAPALDTLTVGETVQLSSTARDASGNVLTGRTVEWASGNTSVATVTSVGVVTAIQPGEATITATIEGQVGTATIVVRLAPVASVLVTPASDTILIGETVQLTTTARDAAGGTLIGRSVTWSSSDETKATVDQTGTVRAVDIGVVTISAHIEGITGTSTITVQPLTGPQGVRNWIGGAAAGPTNWSLPTNWSPAQVPSAVDTAVVGSSVSVFPVLTGPVTVAGLRVAGGVVDLGGNSLTVTSGAAVTGTVPNGQLIVNGGFLPQNVSQLAGTFGQLTLNGGHTWLAGTFASVALNGTSVGSVTGSMSVSGSLTLTGSSEVWLNGNHLTVAALTTSDAATVWMKHGADTLDVTGDVMLNAPVQLYAFFAGVFRHSGSSFIASQGFTSTGTTFVFRGSGSQVVSTGIGSTFGDVVLANTQATNPASTNVGVVFVHRTFVGGTLQLVSGQLSMQDSVEIAGELTTAAGTALVGTVLTLRSQGGSLGIGGTYNVAELFLWGGGGQTLWQLRTDLPYRRLTIGSYSAGESRLVLTGSVTVSEHLKLASAADVQLNGHHLTVGALTMHDFSKVTMTNMADTLDVTGNVTLNGVPFGNALTAGVLRHSGPSFAGVFASAGTVVVFRGSGPQIVSGVVLDFRDVVLANTQATDPANTNVGVVFARADGYPTLLSGTLRLVSGQLSIQGGADFQGELTTASGTVLAGDALVLRSPTGTMGIGGTFNVPVLTLRAASDQQMLPLRPGLPYRNVTVDIGQVVLAGPVTITEHLLLYGATDVRLNGQRLTVGALTTRDLATVTMTNPADTLDATGVVLLNGPTTTSRLTAGVIRHSGPTFAANELGGVNGFVSGGTAVVFRGTGQQLVVMNQGNSFRDVVLENTQATDPGSSYVGVVFVYPTLVTGSLQLVSGQWSVQATTTISTDLTLSAGTVLTGAGNVFYGGTYTNNGAGVYGGTPTKLAGPQGLRTWIGGAAAGPTNWLLPINWSPAQVPTAVDTALVGSSASVFPVLAGPVTVAGLRMPGGAIDLGGASITVSSLTAISGTVHNGELIVNGGGAQLAGTLASVALNGSTFSTLTGPTSVSNRLSLSGTASVRLSGQHLIVNALTTTDAGSVFMADAADTLDATGDVTLTGQANPYGMTHGVFRHSGPSLTASSQGFAPAGTVVVFRGSGPQVVSIPAPVYGINELVLANTQVPNAASMSTGVVLVHPLFVGTAKLLSGQLSIQESVEILGDLTTAPGTVLAGNLLRLRSSSGTSGIRGAYNIAEVFLAAAGGRPEWQLRTDLPYRRLTMDGGRVVLTGPVTISERLTLGGVSELHLNGQHVTVSDLTTTVAGTFSMTNVADTLDVTGSLRLDSGPNPMTAGVLRHSGPSFTSYVGIRSEGTTVVFNGNQAQLVSFYPGGNHFRDVVIANTQATDPASTSVGVIFEGLPIFPGTIVTGTMHVATGQMSVHASVDIGGALTTAPGTVLTGNELLLRSPSGTTGIGGTYNVATLTLRGATNQQTMQLRPDLPYRRVTVDTGRLVLSGPLTVSEHLALNGGTDVQLNGHHLTVEALTTRDLATVTMTNVADTLDAAGAVSLNGTTTASRLTAGVIRHSGLYFLANTQGGVNGFISGGTTVVFRGSGQQYIAVSRDLGNSFRDVVLENTDVTNPGSDQGVMFISGHPTLVTGSLRLVSGQWSVGAATTVSADVTLEAGTIVRGAGNVSYGGTLTNNGAGLFGGIPTKF